jgi:hypothetical protein
MIPDLINVQGAPWSILPPGIHYASLSDIKHTFANNSRRRELFQGLFEAAKALKHAGCRVVYIDGSYVTGKPIPGDYDGCWDPSGVDPSKLDPILLDFDNARQNQKLKYLGELFPFDWEAAPGNIFLNFFQIEKISGRPKGIIAVDLATETFDLVEGGNP